MFLSCYSSSCYLCLRDVEHGRFLDMVLDFDFVDLVASLVGHHVRKLGIDVVAAAAAVVDNYDAVVVGFGNDRALHIQQSGVHFSVRTFAALAAAVAPVFVSVTLHLGMVSRVLSSGCWSCHKALTSIVKLSLAFLRISHFCFV